MSGATSRVAARQRGDSLFLGMIGVAPKVGIEPTHLSVLDFESLLFAPEAVVNHDNRWTVLCEFGLC